MVDGHEALLRLGTALVLGSLIGAERQWRHHMAGLQTNALVAVGAATFVLIAATAEGDASGLARVAAQVASGIGFLGAGVIMRQGLNVHGLNTAATLWCSAAIGAFAGAGQMSMAAPAALLVIFANLLLHPLATAINRLGQPFIEEPELEYLVSVTCESGAETQIRALLLHGGELALRRLDSRRQAPGGPVEVVATFVSSGRDDPAVEQIVARLSLEASVSAVKWQILPRND
jgi:putative Mg2+ transporter-C (MgtC) family protein